jgi:hypothetical protein
MQDALLKLDHQIGVLYDAIKYRQKKFQEKWAFFITTDHGRDEKDGKNHGGQSLRQRSTWMVTNLKLNAYAKRVNPGIVDIMPTLATYLHINIPKPILNEIDGTSLMGKVSLIEPQINVFQQKLDLTWTSLDASGTLKIWISTNNNYSVNGKEAYILLSEVPLNQNRAVFDISKYPSNFYKVVLEGKHNTVNRWFTK